MEGSCFQMLVLFTSCEACGSQNVSPLTQFCRVNTGITVLCLQVSPELDTKSNNMEVGVKVGRTHISFGFRGGNVFMYVP